MPNDLVFDKNNKNQKTIFINRSFLKFFQIKNMYEDEELNAEEKSFKEDDAYISDLDEPLDPLEEADLRLDEEEVF